MRLKVEVIEYENSVAYDCDDTLVLWDSPNDNTPGKVAIPFADRLVYLTPHQYHIDLMRMYKQRGYHITVWSANGHRHAANVCAALGIEAIVDHARGKLSKYVDDNPNPAEVLGTRVFCKDLTKNYTLNSMPLPQMPPVGSGGSGKSGTDYYIVSSDGTKIYYSY
jgi:hypothetical protein